MDNNLSFMLNDANFNEDGSEKPVGRLKPGTAALNTPALKHVKDMSPAEYNARLDEVTNPKLKFALHTIAKHASKMDDVEYKKELTRLMDCFSA
ncbi:MAG TPA: hypothetical protein VIE65_03785 [Methylobacter sp.]|jgi:hypothetical protein